MDSSIVNIKIDEEIIFDKLYTINNKGLYIKETERANLYIKFILSKSKNKDDLISKSTFQTKENGLIHLSLNNSIDEYSFIMNNENYNEIL